ncbi:glycosyltransferase [Salipaludibacillus sp. CF4.18]|uniref:glycosyltransferase n=1 Tax=Salipaludibacillus sp. CF4.18 TaxID=3373081 RepID=UPI003EE5E76A
MILTGYLVVFFLLIGWTGLNGISLPSLKTQIKYKELPKVSVLIPLRNEEENVFSLIDSLKALTYKNTEYIFLNDNSTDNTTSFLHQAIHGDNHYRVIEGKPLPKKWVGKVHACHQLSEAATGDYLLFLDADVRVHPETIQRSLMAFKKDTGLVTGFPNYPLKSILGHLLVPMQHFVVFLHLPILLANKTTWPAATAAHGIQEVCL